MERTALFETTPRKYCKRPVEVMAIRFVRDNFEDVKTFTGGLARDLFIERCINGKCTCVIPTLEGDHIAAEGDYIICGVKDEFYPCKPDVFLKTYELVETVDG